MSRFLLQLVLALTVICVLGFGSVAFAARISGIDYLNQVNAQRQAAGIAVLSPTSGQGEALVRTIDGLSDGANEFLQQRNSALPQWLSSAQQVGQVASQYTIDPATQTADPNKSQYSPVSGNECGLTNLTACWRWFMATMGQLWLTVGGYLVLSAGTIFDVLIKHIIVDFKGTLEMLGTPGTNALTTINIVWTVFRDFANILIIGMFVFIAVSLILGLKEFGQKKLIANVLIVAVLLNFSLLFTTLVIDGSNFVAKQFYSGMAGSTIGGNSGIAQAFLKPMGITTIWEDAGKLTKEAAKQKESGWAAFFLGVIGGLMLVIVAFTLLYGSYLIAARGVLFLVLMITSAVAFATYLIPSLSSGEYGFKAWLKTLLNAAIFAPLLMLSLAASLAIIVTASKLPTPALGSIVVEPKDLATSATAVNAWQSIFLYALGTALLFVSFRLSSKFAGHISGFNLGSLAAMVPLGFAGKLAASAGGAALRQSAGRYAYNRSQTLQTKARDANAMAGFHTSEASRFAEALKKAQASGDSKAIAAAQQGLKNANLMADRFTTEAMKAARASAAQLEKAGKTYSFAGEDKAKSFGQRKQEQAKQAAKIAEIARPSDEQKEKVRQRTTAELQSKNAENFKGLTEARDRANAEAAQKQAAYDQAVEAGKTIPPQLQEEAKRTQDALRTIKQNREMLVEAHQEAERKKLEEILAAPDADKPRLRQELAGLLRQQASELQVSSRSVAQAEKEAEQVKQAIEAPVNAAKKARDDARKAADAAQSAIEKLSSDIEAKVNLTVKTVATGAELSTVEVAAKAGKKVGGLVDGNRVAELARAQYKKQNDATSLLRKLIQDSETLPPSDTKS